VRRRVAAPAADQLARVACVFAAPSRNVTRALRRGELDRRRAARRTGSRPAPMRPRARRGERRGRRARAAAPKNSRAIAARAALSRCVRLVDVDAKNACGREVVW
jgi:hypothetical protein